jgi:uncharacterized short protein YbdD (DUF466 family)
MQDKWELAKLKFSERIRLSGKCAGQGEQLMVGIPDYQIYAAHIARAHPGQAPMTYKQFFRERQTARLAMAARGACGAAKALLIKHFHHAPSRHCEE